MLVERCGVEELERQGNHLNGFSGKQETMFTVGTWFQGSVESPAKTKANCYIQMAEFLV